MQPPEVLTKWRRKTFRVRIRQGTTSSGLCLQRQTLGVTVVLLTVGYTKY